MLSPCASSLRLPILASLGHKIMYVSWETFGRPEDRKKLRMSEDKLTVVSEPVDAFGRRRPYTIYTCTVNDDTTSDCGGGFFFPRYINFLRSFFRAFFIYFFFFWVKTSAPTTRRRRPTLIRYHCGATPRRGEGTGGGHLSVHVSSVRTPTTRRRPDYGASITGRGRAAAGIAYNNIIIIRSRARASFYADTFYGRAYHCSATPAH